MTYLGGISASFVDFSRDGQWFTDVVYPEGTLWRSRLDGSKMLQLTFTPIETMVPKWLRNGQYLYYLRYGPESAVMRVRVSDRQEQEVASLKGILQTGRLAGLEFGLTPNGAPIVLRDVGTQEIYSLDWCER